MKIRPWAEFESTLPDDQIDSEDEMDILQFAGKGVSEALAEILKGLGCEVLQLIYLHERGWEVLYKGGAKGKTLFFDHDVEVTCDRTGGITDHRVTDFVDRFRCIVPGLVGEMCIGRDAVDFNAQGFEGVVMIRQVTELGGADKGEVGRVKEHDGPFALE